MLKKKNILAYFMWYLTVKEKEELGFVPRLSNQINLKLCWLDMEHKEKHWPSHREKTTTALKYR